jgi:hypothetical protein
MKTFLSFPRVAYWALALGTSSMAATYADTTTPPSTTTPAATTDGGFHHHHGAILTDAEKAQLKNARHEAYTVDPTLKTDKENLKQAFTALKAQGQTADKDQWRALRTQKVAYHEKLRAAELKVDPTLAPVFAKLDAAPHHHWHHSST